MRDRRQDSLGLVLDAELDEAEIGRDTNRAIEGHAIQTVLVDIAQEIGGGDRRMGAVEVEHDGPEAGLHRDADHDRLGASVAAGAGGMAGAVWAASRASGRARSSGSPDEDVGGRLAGF